MKASSMKYAYQQQLEVNLREKFKLKRDQVFNAFFDPSSTPPNMNELLYYDALMLDSGATRVFSCKSTFKPGPQTTRVEESQV